jgi:hypothetical protein
MFQRSDIARDFYHIIEGYPGRLFQLKEQQIGKRGLGAFNLRRKHRLTTDIGVKKDIRLR